MAFFGSKCSRCGNRTGRKGDTTCDSCRATVELRVQAQDEVQRLCPVDGTTMTKDVAHMLVLDRCPQCRGVWLDGGELEHIAEINDKALAAMSRGMLVY